MQYKTPNALEMAVKTAAKNSILDTGRAVSGFYFHRLLCRIFSNPDGRFVLKGGQGMLARTIDARATRDIDLLSEEESLADALEALKAAAAIDLNDHMRFIFENVSEIKAGDEYREGLSVTFTPWLGSKRMQQISIDLVVDEVPLDCAESVVPADRVHVEGIEVCNYLVYPAENALADKLCAIEERHHGQPSSRVKDLVDILVYATSCTIDGSRLAESIRRESSVRKIALTESFTIPKEWEKLYKKQYSKLHAQTGLSDSYASIAEASKLAAELFNPILSAKAEGLYWEPDNLEWKQNPRSQ